MNEKGMNDPEEGISRNPILDDSHGCFVWLIPMVKKRILPFMIFIPHLLLFVQEIIPWVRLYLEQAQMKAQMKQPEYGGTNH